MMEDHSKDNSLSTTLSKDKKSSLPGLTKMPKKNHPPSIMLTENITEDKSMLILSSLTVMEPWPTLIIANIKETGDKVCSTEEVPFNPTTVTDTKVSMKKD